MFNNSNTPHSMGRPSSSLLGGSRRSGGGGGSGRIRGVIRFDETANTMAMATGGNTNALSFTSVVAAEADATMGAATAAPDIEHNGDGATIAELHHHHRDPNPYPQSMLSMVAAPATTRGDRAEGEGRDGEDDDVGNDGDDNYLGPTPLASVASLTPAAHADGSGGGGSGVGDFVHFKGPSRSGVFNSQSGYFSQQQLNQQQQQQQQQQNRRQQQNTSPFLPPPVNAPATVLMLSEQHNFHFQQESSRFLGVAQINSAIADESLIFASESAWSSASSLRAQLHRFDDSLSLRTTNRASHSYSFSSSSSSLSSLLFRSGGPQAIALLAALGYCVAYLYEMAMGGEEDEEEKDSSRQSVHGRRFDTVYRTVKFIVSEIDRRLMMGEQKKEREAMNTTGPNSFEQKKEREAMNTTGPNSFPFIIRFVDSLLKEVLSVDQNEDDDEDGDNAYDVSPSSPSYSSPSFTQLLSTRIAESIAGLSKHSTTGPSSSPHPSSSSPSSHLHIDQFILSCCSDRRAVEKRIAGCVFSTVMKPTVIAVRLTSLCEGLVAASAAVLGEEEVKVQTATRSFSSQLPPSTMMGRALAAVFCHADSGEAEHEHTATAAAAEERRAFPFQPQVFLAFSCDGGGTSFSDYASNGVADDDDDEATMDALFNTTTTTTRGDVGRVESSGRIRGGGGGGGGHSVMSPQAILSLQFSSLLCEHVLKFAATTSLTSAASAANSSCFASASAPSSFSSSSSSFSSPHTVFRALCDHLALFCCSRDARRSQPANSVSAIKPTTVWDLMAAPPSSENEIRAPHQNSASATDLNSRFVSSGCAEIDAALAFTAPQSTRVGGGGGGFLRGHVTEIYGEAGSGKTQIGLQTVVFNASLPTNHDASPLPSHSSRTLSSPPQLSSHANNNDNCFHSAIYLVSEDVPQRRIRQFAEYCVARRDAEAKEEAIGEEATTTTRDLDAEVKRVLDRVFIRKVPDLASLVDVLRPETLDAFVRQHNVSAIVVDSIAACWQGSVNEAAAAAASGGGGGGGGNRGGGGGGGFNHNQHFSKRGREPMGGASFDRPAANPSLSSSSPSILLELAGSALSVAAARLGIAVITINQARADMEKKENGGGSGGEAKNAFNGGNFHGSSSSSPTGGGSDAFHNNNSVIPALGMRWSNMVKSRFHLFRMRDSLVTVSITKKTTTSEKERGEKGEWREVELIDGGRFVVKPFTYADFLARQRSEFGGVAAGGLPPLAATNTAFASPSSPSRALQEQPVRCLACVFSPFRPPSVNSPVPVASSSSSPTTLLSPLLPSPAEYGFFAITTEGLVSARVF